MEDDVSHFHNVVYIKHQEDHGVACIFLIRNIGNKLSRYPAASSKFAKKEATEKTLNCLELLTGMPLKRIAAAL